MNPLSPVLHDDAIGKLHELEQMVRYYERQADEAAGAFVQADAQLSIAKRDLTQNILAFNILSYLRNTIRLDEHEDASGIFDRTLALIHGVLHVDRSVVFLRAPGGFKVAHSLGLDASVARRLAMLTFGFTPEEIGESGYLVVNRKTKVGEFVETLRETLGIRFFVCVPIFQGDETIGYLLSGNDKEAYPFFPPFNQRHLETYTAIAGFLSVSYANLMLYRDLAEHRAKLEVYNRQLEAMVEERTEDLEQKADQLSREKARSEDLLLNLLPEVTARELQLTGQAIPRDLESVTVVMADIVGFSRISEHLDADELVARLDQVFRAFDHVIVRHNLEKIKTIGDAYMFAGGLPIENKTHAVDAVEACLEFVQYLETLRNQRRFADTGPFEMRFGIHTGPVVAGVVGSKKFAYDIWGHTVNVAKRVESASAPNRVTVSGTTAELVRRRFDLEPRGPIEIKGGEQVEMFFVTRRR